MPSLWGMQLTCPDLVQIYFLPATKFTFWYVHIFCPCIILHSGHNGVIYPCIYQLWFHTYFGSVHPAVIIVPVFTALSHIHAMNHVHVCIWVIRSGMVVHFVSGPSGDWCLCSDLCNLVCVWHGYSACHSHLVGSPSMVIAVAFNDLALCPRTPFFLSGQLLLNLQKRI